MTLALPSQPAALEVSRGADQPDQALLTGPRTLGSFIVCLVAVAVTVWFFILRR